MRKTTATLASVAVAATFTLTACGSSNTNSNSSNSSSSGPAKSVSAACSLSNPPTSGAKLPAATNLGKAKGKVGVILPDTTSSTRYTLYDKPLLQKALTGAGITADIQNAQGDKNKFASIAQNMIGEGVKVLMIDSIDAPSGAGVEQKAAAAGVKVIDYDRVNLGGSAGYYVSFDNEDVGKLQAQTLVDCLDAQGVKDPNIIMMDGGTDVDNNAVLFKKGAHEVLDPLQQQGKLKIVSESVVKGWNVSNAAPAFNQALTAAGGKVDGVLAANDDIANAVIGVLKKNGLAGHVAVTGQDSGVEGLQNIVTGQQSMTVFKNVKLEAQAAAQLAIALIQGKDPSKAGMTLTNFNDPQKPSHKIQALLLPAQVITQANVNDVVKAGALTTAEICKGITSACSKLGLS
ncbi:sugar ABC transporter substrate-binding protein [Nocardioides terrisoli]|uniref:sugar ABC transporter substrate-binding protein n=1 Tax=Nocardioides terrisoli TaxID=3388267 RepID=UPI00287B92BF|nr:substrate-binding domain-containing protein [Nocardioides marmorisolisilvae]